MVTVAYVHDGASVYDSLFLEHLTSENPVYFLTFNPCPKFANRARVVMMQEPLLKFTSRMEWIEGLRMYTLAFLRALILSLHLRRLKPQIVFACMATKYGFYTALSMSRPFVLIVWGTDVLIAPKRSFLLRFLAKYSLTQAAAVILDSDVQKNAAIQLSCNPEKILKFPWFDVASVHSRVSKKEIRERLGWSRNLVVVCTRGHEPIYGVEHLIEAVPHVLKQLPESRFLIIGKGRLTKQLKERAKELQIESFVKFLGSIPRKDVISYLNAADLNVSPSFSDGTSASLLEAMSLGVPSVATDIPGNREWIENGWDGCLVPVRDSRKLAEALVSLLRDESLRGKMGERAVEKVNDKVDWRANAQTLRSLIAKLVESHKKEELP